MRPSLLAFGLALTASACGGDDAGLTPDGQLTTDAGVDGDAGVDASTLPGLSIVFDYRFDDAGFFTRIGTKLGRHWRFRRDAIDAWLDQSGQQAVKARRSPSSSRGSTTRAMVIYDACDGVRVGMACDA